MMPGPVGRAIRGGITRKRVQTLAIGLVLLVSTAASVLALALLVDSNAPFDKAFTAQHGAHVVVTFDPAKATLSQLAATKRLPGVTAAAGPFAEATVSGTTSRGSGSIQLPSVTLAGRSSPGGAVDDVVLQSGHWANGPGQLVLDTHLTNELPPIPLGTKITVDGGGAASKHIATLTLVGTAASVTGSSGGWVTAGEVAKLAAAHAPASTQMLYRFSRASDAKAIASDVRTVAAALPGGAVAGTQSWLAADLAETGNIKAFVPFLIAFGAIGLVMSVLIVTNVVSGAVVAGYRRIGVLKSIGFTPGQIVSAYASQAAVPAVIGCICGVVLGDVLAKPVLSKAATVYGVGALQVPTWVDVIVPVAMCLLVAIAAVLPALRAGRLSAVQAIATGRAPATGRGYAAHRLFGRLALPRPVTIGLAAPFARPARTAMTLIAILLGATVVTFAVGLSSSLNLVVAGLERSKAAPVTVLPGQGEPVGPHFKIKPGGGGPGRGGKQPSAAAMRRAVEDALRTQPGTLHYAEESELQVSVAGLAQQVDVAAFRGNARWTGYAMISGHWYTGPDQVVVATHFLTETGKSIGDEVTIYANGRPIHVRIVGEVFATRNTGLFMITDWKTVSAALSGAGSAVAIEAGPQQFDIGIKPGVSADAYASSLQAKLGHAYLVLVNNRSSDVVDLMISLIGTLTVLLMIVAGLGVLNTIVLHTRERVHDLGVFKAVGMTPRQTVTMVVCWVAGTGLVASVIAVPLGIALHGYVLPAMARSVDLGLPASFLNVYHAGELALLGLTGIVIAVAGALLPATWAAAIGTGAALHAE
jgi:putative ABC transport system permease protein